MKLTLMFLFGALLCFATFEDPVVEVWKRIEVARKAKVKKPHKLNPPASKEAIDKLEEHLACEIPAQLRASLLLHDGMEDLGLEIVDGKTTQLYGWLGVAGIRKQWDEDRQRQKEAEAEGDEFEVDPEWIPIFVDPVDSEEIIYLDSTNGNVLLRLLPASQEIQQHRYTDLVSFLDVLEHHIRTGLRYEWGNDIKSKPTKPELTLDEKGISSLIKSNKEKVSLKLADGKSIEIKANGNEFANAILESLKPVKYVRTPGVQEPDQQLSFSVDGKKDYLIAIKRASEGKLSYSIDNRQFYGGDAAKLEKLMSTLEK